MISSLRVFLRLLLLQPKPYRTSLFYLLLIVDLPTKIVGKIAYENSMGKASRVT
jgi:hypothetical protein